MTHHLYQSITRAMLLFSLILLITSCSNNDQEVIDYKDYYELQSGGNLVNAMVGEPSNLIAMIAGD